MKRRNAFCTVSLGRSRWAGGWGPAACSSSPGVRGGSARRSSRRQRSSRRHVGSKRGEERRGHHGGDSPGSGSACRVGGGGRRCASRPAGGGAECRQKGVQCVGKRQGRRAPHPLFDDGNSSTLTQQTSACRSTAAAAAAAAGAAPAAPLPPRGRLARSPLLRLRLRCTPGCRQESTASAALLSLFLWKRRVGTAVCSTSRESRRSCVKICTAAVATARNTACNTARGAGRHCCTRPSLQASLHHPSSAWKAGKSYRTPRTEQTRTKHLVQNSPGKHLGSFHSLLAAACSRSCAMSRFATSYPAGSEGAPR